MSSKKFNPLCFTLDCLNGVAVPPKYLCKSITSESIPSLPTVSTVSKRAEDCKKNPLQFSVVSRYKQFVYWTYFSNEFKRWFNSLWLVQMGWWFINYDDLKILTNHYAYLGSRPDASPYYHRWGTKIAFRFSADNRPTARITNVKAEPSKPNLPILLITVNVFVESSDTCSCKGSTTSEKFIAHSALSRLTNNLF